MKQFIRRWLGIEELDNKLTSIMDGQITVNAHVLKAELKMVVHNAALGRILAKLDPMYGVSEHDPVRRAESDRLGRDIIDKLTGETKVQRRNLGRSG